MRAVRCGASTLALVMLALLAAGAALPAQAIESAVALQYHHFGSDTPRSTSVTVEEFEQHLDYLEEHDFVVWPIEKIVAHFQKGLDIPERCVAITIDDGYVSVFTEAFPRLYARGWPFTVFLSTEPIELGLDGYMTWEQIKEMREAGIKFANHTHTHAHLVRRRDGESEAEWRLRVTDDIRACRTLLLNELYASSDIVAYPYGEYDVALRDLVRELGYVGVGQQSGPIGMHSDFGALPRFPMSGPYADIEQFAPKVHSLPFPLVSVEPVDPVLAADEARPVLRVTLGLGTYAMDQFACYAGAQGRIPVRWVDREKRILEVQAPEALPMGRSRYNLTAPHESENRYFWFSHLWIRGSAHDD